jgi:hypothetical protein
MLIHPWDAAISDTEWSAACDRRRLGEYRRRQVLLAAACRRALGGRSLGRPPTRLNDQRFISTSKTQLLMRPEHDGRHALAAAFGALGPGKQAVVLRAGQVVKQLFALA